MVLYNASSRARNAARTMNQPSQKVVGDMPPRTAISSWGSIYRRGRVYNNTNYWLTSRQPKASPLAGIRFSSAMGVDHW